MSIIIIPRPTKEQQPTKSNTISARTAILKDECQSNHNQSLYVKIENPTYSTVPDRDAPWSDGEILRLLEALERYDEKWDEIAEYVGTRTREECVVKFLQFEIEDKYIDSEPINRSTGISMLGSQQGHLPFSQADNPVMSVIGFLASLTEPSVTAAAANKTVEAMKQSLRTNWRNLIHQRRAKRRRETQWRLMLDMTRQRRLR